MITVKPLKRCGALLLTTAVAMMFIMSACSRVAEGDRLIYVPPASAERNVLIEDFTGQRCVNCPAATKKIEELHSQYGDRIIPVAIHSGPFAHRSTMSSPLLSLGTATGDEFYRNRGVEAQPGVAVNRHGGIIYNTNLYATAVAECIAQETPLNITATCQYEESSRSLTVNISANELIEAFVEPMNRILEAVHNVLERTPPQLVGDLDRNGIVMSGGGSLIYGIDRLIERSTGIRTVVVDDPVSCAAYGAGKMLKHLEDMQDGMMNFYRKRQLKG